MSGAGGLLQLSTSRWIQFECNLGIKTNNEAEVRAVTILMSLTLEKEIKDMKIVGDSKLIICWLDGSMVNETLNLNGVVSLALELKSLFHKISFDHVLRE
jgi:ribonuclease HI